MGLFSSIHYVVGIPDQHSEEKTLFQGFTEEALYATEPLFSIARLPSNIFEVFIPRDKWTRPRVYGATNFSVHIAHESILPTSVSPSISAPWWVVILPEKQLADFNHAFVNRGIPPLTASVIQIPEHPFPQLTSTTKAIKTWARKVLNHCMLQGSREAHAVANALAATKGKSQNGPRKVAAPLRAHNVTTPNELTLLSAGYDFSGFSPFPQFSVNPPEQSATKHDQAVTSLSSTIQYERDRVLAMSPRHALTPGVDAVLAVQSMRPDAHTGRRFWAQRPPDEHTADFRRMSQVLKMIGRQEGPTIDITTDEEVEAVQSPIGQFVIRERRRELDLLTSALSIKGAEQFCPTIRLPSSLNKLRPIWSGMSRCARGRSPHMKFKLNQLALKAADQFDTKVNPDLRRVIGKAARHIKFVGDLPLELVRCDRTGTALSVNTAISRIPTLPGDLAVQQLVSNVDLYTTPSAFKKTLILRSFGNDDVLRTFAEHSLREFLGENFRHLEVVDVSTIVEAEETLSRFTGGMVIFDMHGGITNGVGVLDIGDEKWDLVSSAQKIRLPPVVLFSACDTAPMDGVAASIASAALAVGAKVVLGTLMPVNGAESALLVGRTMLRVNEFIPAAHEAFRRGVRWTEVFGGMMKMSYASDVLRAMLMDAVPRAEYLEDHLAINTSINIDNPNDEWWGTLISRIAKRLDQSAEEIKCKIQQNLYFTETCKYSMFGSPEHLIVMPD